MAKQREPGNDPLASSETELFNAELLAMLSHELRRPLTAIKGYATTLLRHERRISREGRKECLRVIITASDRLDQMVERFLDLSQMETGALKLERSPVDVARLAQEACWSQNRAFLGTRPRVLPLDSIWAMLLAHLLSMCRSSWPILAA